MIFEICVSTVFLKYCFYDLTGNHYFNYFK